MRCISGPHVKENYKCDRDKFLNYEHEERTQEENSEGSDMYMSFMFERRRDQNKEEGGTRI